MATSMNRIERMGRIESSAWGIALEDIGEVIIRYGLVVILLWIGALKFTAYEAANIQGLVANSPLMSWVYSVMTPRGFSSLIGVIEVTLGILIALRPISPKLSAIGSLGAVGMFLITLSFILTTPGVWQQGYGFPYPSSSPGQFLLKDLVNLGAATYTAGESLRAARL
jgi:reactive chlorine resistance protein C